MSLWSLGWVGVREVGMGGGKRGMDDMTSEEAYDVGDTWVDKGKSVWNDQTWGRGESWIRGSDRV